MSGWSEPFPDLIAATPKGDPLGESVLDPQAPAVRVFEPQSTCVVLGRAQNPQREVNLVATQAAGIPLHRRITGGGTVVLSPGMVVVALRLPGDTHDPQRHFARVNARLIPALAQLGVSALCRGHGDLTVASDDGQRRKILGASLRQDARAAYYLGVFLVADARDAMEQYLAAPSRQPEYRGQRSHRDFCDYLGRFGVGVEPLIATLRDACSDVANWTDLAATCAS